MLIVYTLYISKCTMCLIDWQNKTLSKELKMANKAKSIKKEIKNRKAKVAKQESKLKKLKKALKKAN